MNRIRFTRSAAPPSSAEPRAPAPANYAHRSGLGGVLDHLRDSLQPRPVRRQAAVDRSLRRAALAGDATAVNNILSTAAPAPDLSALSRSGHSALHNAARSGSAEVTRAILGVENSPNPNQQNPRSGRTALHYAVKAESPEVVSVLASEPATVSLADHAGMTPHGLALDLVQAHPTDPRAQAIEGRVANLRTAFEPLTQRRAGTLQSSDVRVTRRRSSEEASMVSVGDAESRRIEPLPAYTREERAAGPGVAGTVGSGRAVTSSGDGSNRSSVDGVFDGFSPQHRPLGE